MPTLYRALNGPYPAAEFIEVLVAALAERAAAPRRARRRGGGTLRPGVDTPLWNELRRQLGPHLSRYGQQARLGRLLALPRQRVHAFVTAGSEMPDAERTLQLIVWLAAAQKGLSPGLIPMSRNT